MSINIIEEKENPIFERKEVRGEFVSNETLPKSKIIAELAVKYKVKENQIDLKYVINHRGVHKGEFFALIYNKPIKEEANENSENAQEDQQVQQEQSQEASA
ncbi:MAG: hypothetical protein GXN99_00560 [Candidatus Nanohaloarchaeota archaeon]|nr:hypothetical protein [Candidatus Nanohaloarchaeota archaeon]